MKFPEECNLDETQDNELKIAILNMCNKFREDMKDMNNCWNEDQERSVQRNEADIEKRKV